MENQQNNKNTPMTNEELDQFLQDISSQVAEPEHSPPEEPVRKPPRKPAARKSLGKRFKKFCKRVNSRYSKLQLILLGFFATVFIVSAIVGLSYLLRSCEQQRDYQNLADIVASIQAAQPSQTPTTKPPVPTYPDGLPINPPTEPTVQQILPEYKDLFDMNNDLVGWIKVPDTKINYPVVQSPPEEKNFYIDHDFYRRARGCGAIYVRESCDVFEPSDNVTMYGHHMKDMSMFAGLDYYVEKSFWESHQTFTFDTIFEHHTYQVMAIFRTSANLGEGFSFHQFENAASEKEFNAFVNTVKGLALYDTGVTAEYGDKLVCLSTCEYSMSNGRLVVVAKRIS